MTHRPGPVPLPVHPRPAVPEPGHHHRLEPRRGHRGVRAGRTACEADDDNLIGTAEELRPRLAAIRRDRYAVFSRPHGHAGQAVAQTPTGQATNAALARCTSIALTRAEQAMPAGAGSCGLKFRVGISRLMPDGSRIRRGAETCRSRLYLVYLVRVERRRLDGQAAAPGTASRVGTVASTEGPAPHGRTRRPQGRPPHQDPGPSIAVRPPRTRTKTYFCRRTVSWLTGP